MCDEVLGMTMDISKREVRSVCMMSNRFDSYWRWCNGAVVYLPFFWKMLIQQFCVAVARLEVGKRREARETEGESAPDPPECWAISRQNTLTVD